jgi:hypothetical protein
VERKPGRLRGWLEHILEAAGHLTSLLIKHQPKDKHEQRVLGLAALFIVFLVLATTIYVSIYALPFIATLIAMFLASRLMNK